MCAIMQLTISQLAHYFDLTLAEDLGVGGDVTSNAVILEPKMVHFQIASREEIVLCGVEVIEYFLQKYSDISYHKCFKDKDLVHQGGVILEGEGDAHQILKLERVMLNYLQHLSAVATLTHKYIKEVTGYKAKICDTRKTTPGMRMLEKYAVKCGGGSNHRYGLDSGILIKDNHIAICGGVGIAIANARANAPHYSKIEVECDTLEQVQEALSAEADIILLDNMTCEQISKAMNMIQGKAEVDVSGGVRLENVREIAALGVHYISIGRLTHSAPAVDIGLDL